MPMAEYLADPCPEPSLSSGLIHTLLTSSPRHAWYNHPKLNPNREPEESAAFDAGSAAHAILAGDESSICVIEANDYRTNAAKEKRDEARAAGLIPVLAKDMYTPHAMKVVALEKIERNPDLAGIFGRSKPEQVLVWQSIIGPWFRGRADWLSDDRSIILDYKTTSGSANPETWIRTHLTAHGYDIQAELYRQGVEDILGTRPNWFWLVQENKPPYSCSIISPGQAMEEIAAEKIERATGIFCDCLASGDWPAYADQTYYAEYPEYEITKWETSKLLLKPLEGK